MTEEAERLFRRALDGAGEDHTLRSGALEGLAQVALRKGEPATTVVLAKEALAAVDQQPEERPGLAESLARAHGALGQVADAIAVLQRCVERFADDPVQFVRFAGFLGAALTDNGDFSEAERVLGLALARGREIADPYTRARLYWSQSRMLVEAGRSQEAEAYAERTLEILRTTEDEYALAHILQTLAKIKIDLEQPAEALELLREGWPKLAAVGSPTELTQFRIEEARALAALGENEQAAALAMELALALDGVEPVDAGRAQLLLGQTFLKLGDYERAKELLELAIEVLEQQPPSRYLVQAYKDLANALKDHGETAAAFEILERALGVQHTAGRPLA